MSARITATPDAQGVALRDRDDLRVFPIGEDFFPSVSVAAATPAGTIACTTSHVVEHVSDAARTVVAVYGGARLAASRVELPLATRLVAVGARWLLLASATGGHVVRVSATPMLAPLLVAAHIDWAVGLAGDEFLVESQRGIEVWDASARRPVRRLHLDRPAGVVAHGIAGNRSTLWFAGASGDITTIRVSDGKLGKVRLAGPLERIVGHPGSSWLVGDLDGAPRALNLVTAALSTLQFPSVSDRALLPDRSEAVLAQVESDGALSWWAFGGHDRSRASRPGLTMDLGPGTTPAVRETFATAVAVAAEPPRPNHPGEQTSTPNAHPPAAADVPANSPLPPTQRSAMDRLHRLRGNAEPPTGGTESSPNARPPGAVVQAPLAGKTD